MLLKLIEADFVISEYHLGDFLHVELLRHTSTSREIALTLFSTQVGQEVAPLHLF